MDGLEILGFLNAEKSMKNNLKSNNSKDLNNLRKTQTPRRKVAEP